MTSFDMRPNKKTIGADDTVLVVKHFIGLYKYSD